MNNMYESLSDALNDLHKRGYTTPFGIESGNLLHRNKGEHLNPKEFTIDEFYRFEDTDPADESIVYAISSNLLNLKGVLVNGFGTSADPDISDLIEQLSIRKSI